jgi:hypothetical protein
MRRTYSVFFLAVWFLLCGPAYAEDPPADRPVINQAAATLLLPYFEVDLGSQGFFSSTTTNTGQNTVFEINNASATAVLAHVTVWSDYGIPVLAFNVYLTGYDMQTVDLRSVFKGVLPITASAGQDSFDQISNKGPLSQDINFASCSGQLPYGNLTQDYVTHIQSALTGKSSSFLGGCAGSSYGDRIARGYVTVDTVNNCTLRVASDPGYFGPGGSGDVTNQNVLWGDYYFVNQARRVLGSDKLVHVKASATDPETNASGQYTFYGRHVNWTAADNREPLSTNWAVPYVSNRSLQSYYPRVVVWRDPKTTPGVNSFACGSPPSAFPLTEADKVIFGNAEQASNLTTPAFPLATQAIPIGGAALPTPYSDGWLFLNLNHAKGNGIGEGASAAQAWVTLMNNNGRYAVGHGAKRLDTAKSASNIILIP